MKHIKQHKRHEKKIEVKCKSYRKCYEVWANKLGMEKVKEENVESGEKRDKDEEDNNESCRRRKITITSKDTDRVTNEGSEI